MSFEFLSHYSQKTFTTALKCQVAHCMEVNGDCRCQALKIKTTTKKSYKSTMILHITDVLYLMSS